MRKWFVSKSVKAFALVIFPVGIVAVIAVSVLQHVSTQNAAARAKRAEIKGAEAVVQQWINEHVTGPGDVVTNNVAVTTGGDFVAVQSGSDAYNVFYTSKQDGKWSAQFAGIYAPKADPLAAGVSMGSTSKYVSDISVSVPQNLSISKVIVQARFGYSNKDTPVSLTELGTLSYWVYNLTPGTADYKPGATMVRLDSVRAYDDSGHMVWSKDLKHTK